MIFRNTAERFLGYVNSISDIVFSAYTASIFVSLYTFIVIIAFGTLCFQLFEKIRGKINFENVIVFFYQMIGGLIITLILLFFSYLFFTTY